MHEKLDEIEKRYEELQRKIEDPSIVTDVAAYRVQIWGAEPSTILRVLAYWTNVQRALSMSVVIFAFDDPGGYKNTTSCFLIARNE